jgi:hypothetical protein
MDQDVYYFYSYLSSNIEARRTLFEDALANWPSVRLALFSISVC